MRRKYQVAVFRAFDVARSVLADLDPSYAQEARGTIVGRVADSSGAAVPGAQMTVRNLATGVSQRYTTTSTGDTQL